MKDFRRTLLVFIILIAAISGGFGFCVGHTQKFDEKEQLFKKLYDEKEQELRDMRDDARAYKEKIKTLTEENAKLHRESEEFSDSFFELTPEQFQRWKEVFEKERIARIKRERQSIMKSLEPKPE